MDLEYKLKCKEEDFEVTEVPLVPITGKSNTCHTYIWLKKRGMTTFDAEDVLAKYWCLNTNSIHAEGLKDEDAITHQLVSIEKKVSQKEIDWFNSKQKSKSKYLYLDRIIGYGDEPVKETCLHGNTFKIVIRNLDPDTANNLYKHYSPRESITFINYYDTQRFGLAGGTYNTHLIGKAIVEKNWEQFYKEYCVSSNDISKESKSVMKKKDYYAFFTTINVKKVGFFVAAYSSYLWNVAASEVVSKSVNCRCLTLALENITNITIPLADTFNIPNVVTAPAFRFSEDDYTVTEKDFTRSLVTTTTVFALDIMQDILHKRRSAILVSYFLPTGSYATMLIKHLMAQVKNHVQEESKERVRQKT